MHPTLAQHVGSKQHKLHHRPLDSEWYYVKRYPIQTQIAWSTNSGTNFCISCTYHILVTTAPTTFLARTQNNSRENRHNCTYHILWHPPHAPCHELKKTAVRTGKAKTKTICQFESNANKSMQKQNHSKKHPWVIRNHVESIQMAMNINEEKHAEPAEQAEQL